ncbi:MAG: hypothetical protein ACRC78_11055 [Planktothrix sp.]
MGNLFTKFKAIASPNKFVKTNTNTLNISFNNSQKLRDAIFGKPHCCAIVAPLLRRCCASAQSDK